MAGESIVSSVLARGELWFNSAMAWADRPLFGHGLGGFEWAYAAHRADHVGIVPTSTILSLPSVSAGAAHNEVLQIGVEVGVIGLALAVALLVACLRGSRSEARWAVWAILAAGMIGFPLQNPATALVFVVALALSSRPPVRMRYAVRPWVPLGASVAVLAVAAVLTGIGTQSYRAARHMAAAYNARDANPAVSLVHVYEAYIRFPLDQGIRRQLPGSLFSVMARFAGRLEIDPRLADAAWKAGNSVSPSDPLSLLSRIQYLMTLARDLEAAAPVVRRLQIAAPTLPHTWLATSYLFALRGDSATARQAAQTGLNLTTFMDPEIRGRLKEMAR